MADTTRQATDIQTFTHLLQNKITDVWFYSLFTAFKLLSLPLTFSCICLVWELHLLMKILQSFWIASKLTEWICSCYTTVRNIVLRLHDIIVPLVRFTCVVIFTISMVLLQAGIESLPPLRRALLAVVQRFIENIFKLGPLCKRFIKDTSMEVVRLIAVTLYSVEDMVMTKIQNFEEAVTSFTEPLPPIVYTASKTVIHYGFTAPYTYLGRTALTAFMWLKHGTQIFGVDIGNMTLWDLEYLATRLNSVNDDVEEDMTLRVELEDVDVEELEDNVEYEYVDEFVDDNVAEDEQDFEDDNVAEDEQEFEDETVVEDEPEFEDETVVEDEQEFEDEQDFEDETVAEDVQEFDGEKIAEHEHEFEDEKVAEDEHEFQNEKAVEDEQEFADNEKSEEDKMTNDPQD